MNIVQCLTHSTHGGGQQIVYTLVKVLTKQHPEIGMSVILPPGGIFVDRFLSLGIDVIEFPLDRLSVSAMARFREVVSQPQPSVIHSHGKGAGVYARSFIGSSNAAKHVHSYHGFHPPSNQLMNTLYCKLETYLLRHTDCVVTVSESEREEIRQVLHPSKEISSQTIPNVVDPIEVRKRSIEQIEDPMRSFIDALDENIFLVVMIGRDDPVKNYQLAFQTAHTLLGRKKAFAFVFIGVKPQHPQLARLMAAYPDRILGVHEMENPLPILLASNSLLLTSRKEGSPLAVLEAFVLGKPVVGTDVGGIRDLITDHHNGLLCGETPSAVADALELLASDRALYQSLAESSRKVGEAMDPARWSERYLQLYKEACG